MSYISDGSEENRYCHFCGKLIKTEIKETGFYDIYTGKKEIEIIYIDCECLKK